MYRDRPHPSNRAAPGRRLRQAVTRPSLCPINLHYRTISLHVLSTILREQETVEWSNAAASRRTNRLEGPGCCYPEIAPEGNSTATATRMDDNTQLTRRRTASVLYFGVSGVRDADAAKRLIVDYLNRNSVLAFEFTGPSSYSMVASGASILSKPFPPDITEITEAIDVGIVVSVDAIFSFSSTSSSHREKWSENGLSRSRNVISGVMRSISNWQFSFLGMSEAKWVETG